MRVPAIGWIMALWLLIAGTPALFGQSLPANRNLVSNGSFEFSTCGVQTYNDTSFVNNSSYWISANRSGRAFLCPGTYYPDFNVRARTGHGAFILVRMYSQKDLSTGIWTDTQDLARTYAETRLLEPLVAGKTYYLKFYFGAFLDTAAPSRQNQHDQDIAANVGAYFSSSVLRHNGTGQIRVKPQLNFTAHVLPHVDSFMYIELSGAYTAAGGEEYLTLGNFDDLQDIVFMHITKGSRTAGITTAYMNSVFLDDVSLVADTSQPVVSLDRFDLGRDTTLCAGGSIRLGGPPVFFHYRWSTGDTTSTITVSRPGDYWCTVDYGCGTFTDSIRVLPAAPPQPFDLPDTVLCSGTPFIAQAPAGYASYLWSTGSNAASLAIAVPGPVWIQVGNACGQWYRDTFSLVTKPATVPGININTNPPIILCEGTPITFVTNNTGAGSYPTYQWYKNGIAIPGAASVTYTDSALADKDTLTIAMYSAAVCPVTQPTISNRVGVTVSPVLIPSLTISASPKFLVPGQPVTFAAAPVNGGSTPVYTWFRNGLPVAGETGPVWTAYDLEEGDFVSARLESSEPCPSPALVNSNQIVLAGSAGIGSGALTPRIRVYPNPVTDVLNVLYFDPPAAARFELKDNLGRSLIIRNLEHGRTAISLEQLPAGIYRYRITSAAEEYRGKVVKQ